MNIQFNPLQSTPTKENFDWPSPQGRGWPAQGRVREHCDCKMIAIAGLYDLDQCRATQSSSPKITMGIITNIR